MVQIKDMYIALDNIKFIKFEENHFGFEEDAVNKYLVIKHFYDEEMIKISVDSFEEFQELANIIVANKFMKEKGE